MWKRTLSLFFARKGNIMKTQNATSSVSARTLSRGAIIAAIYAALTLLLAPISYGQLRVAEALTLLPIVLPEAVPALTIGCLLANVMGGCTILDIVFGTLATFLAAVLTRRLRAHPVAAMLMPVLLNGVIVGAVVHVAYSPVIPLPLCMLCVAVGEAASCCLLGPVVLRAMERIPQKLLHS